MLCGRKQRKGDSDAGSRRRICPTLSATFAGGVAIESTFCNPEFLNAD
jgi:hypothetical protein